MKLNCTVALLICFNMTIKSQPPTAGLVAHWPFNATYSDIGSSNIATLNYGSTFSTNIFGETNRAVQFANPSSNALVVNQWATHVFNSNVNFGITQNFTYSFSVYMDTLIGAAGFYDNGINYGSGCVWAHNFNGYPACAFNFRNKSLPTKQGSFTAKVWKHVTAVYEKSTGTGINDIIKLYINGILDTSMSVSGAEAATYSSTRLARFGSLYYAAYNPMEYRGFNGRLDEFRIYNRALSSLEILQLSNFSLPVKLAYFTANLNNDVVRLQWQSVYEQNSSHFIIERSTDGAHFIETGNIQATNNHTIPSNYFYHDNLPNNNPFKTLYYRLKMYDKDGKNTLSNMIAVQLNSRNIDLQIAPNPAFNYLNVITKNISGKVFITITDANGRRINNYEFFLNAGSNTLPLNVSNFKRGTYILRLSTASKAFTQKFIKE